MTAPVRPARRWSPPVAEGSLPVGYVEQAVAEFLAGHGAVMAPPGEPFQFCPECGAALDTESFVQEFWVGAESRFLVWCQSCSFTGTVVRVERFETHEAEE